MTAGNQFILLSTNFAIDQPENEDRVDGVEGTQPTDAGASPSEKPKKKRFAWFRGRSLKFWFRTLLLLVLAYVVLVPFVRPLLVMAWSVMPLIVLPLVGIPFGIYLLRRNWRKCGTAMVILTILATGAVTAGNFTGWFVESQIDRLQERVDMLGRLGRIGRTFSV